MHWPLNIGRRGTLRRLGVCWRMSWLKIRGRWVPITNSGSCWKVPVSRVWRWSGMRKVWRRLRQRGRSVPITNCGRPMMIWWRNSRFAGMDLLQAFKVFIVKERLFAPVDRLLLAVSGGVDSMVLTELCDRAGFDFEIVHCNFQLRGAESQRDEEFVVRQAERYGRGVRVRHFDTEAYALSKK